MRSLLKNSWRALMTRHEHIYIIRKRLYSYSTVTDLAKLRG